MIDNGTSRNQGHGAADWQLGTERRSCAPPARVSTTYGALDPSAEEVP